MYFRETKINNVFYIDHFQWSSFIPEDPIFSWVSFLSVQRTSVFLAVWFWLLQILLIFIYIKMYISLLFLKDIFIAYKIMDWQDLFSFSTLKMSLYYLLAFHSFSLKVTILKLLSPVYEVSFFRLLSRIFSLCLSFSSFTMMWLGLDFFLIWGSLNFLNL